MRGATVAETAKTRISNDVWQRAGEVAQRMGLSGERAAIEAVFRCFHNDYVLGAFPDQGAKGNIPLSPVTSMSEKTSELDELSETVNCAADLNNLLDTL